MAGGAGAWAVRWRIGGAPLLVIDVAAVQAAFARPGRLSRIDLRLVHGVDAASWLQRQAWPDGVRSVQPDDAAQRVSNLSRAYRVNLSVLALVALLVGGFLVYSVLALSVAQRTPTFALLGVLGLAERQRRALVLAEAAWLGVAGSVLGLGAGTALAAIALRCAGRGPGRRLLHWRGAAAAMVVAGRARCTVRSASWRRSRAPGGRRALRKRCRRRRH